MPRTDQRYEATREDVLAALAISFDPALNQRPRTEFTIATTIAEYRASFPGSVGRQIKRGPLVELLARMTEEGLVIALPRKQWAALGREHPSRTTDLLYATPAHLHLWQLPLPGAEDATS